MERERFGRRAELVRAIKEDPPPPFANAEMVVVGQLPAGEVNLFKPNAIRNKLYGQGLDRRTRYQITNAEENHFGTSYYTTTHIYEHDGALLGAAIKYSRVSPIPDFYPLQTTTLYGIDTDGRNTEVGVTEYLHGGREILVYTHKIGEHPDQILERAHQDALTMAREIREAKLSRSIVSVGSLTGDNYGLAKAFGMHGIIDPHHVPRIFSMDREKLDPS